jgi:hypothetical protein
VSSSWPEAGLSLQARVVPLDKLRCAWEGLRVGGRKGGAGVLGSEVSGPPHVLLFLKHQHP